MIADQVKVPAGISAGLLAELVELDARRKALEAQDDELKTRRSEVEGQLLEQFVNAGVESVKAHGRTIYLYRLLSASVGADGDADQVDKSGQIERAVEVLVAHGLNDLVETRPQPQRLAAYVRELEKAGEELPPDVAACIRVSEKYSVRTRAAK